MNLLEAEALRKVYPGTVALNNFTAKFEGGKVHSIIGKNGSGKSTLIKIISGAVTPTTGRIRVNGEERLINHPIDAFKAGIATVYQELSLIPEMSAAENIFIGRLPKRGPANICIDWKKTRSRAVRLMESMGIAISADRRIHELSVGEQQVIEIVKAMSFEPSVLMLDEPTSALARHEVGNLFRLIRTLRDKGVVIIYISHRIQELNEIADTVTVLRDGDLVGRTPIEEATTAKIVEMMFGEVVQKKRPLGLVADEGNVLQVENLTRRGAFENISFSVKRGEILGIAGMLGSGRTEVLRALFGADPIDSGIIRFAGEAISRPTPQMMKKLGMALTPENRKQEGLILSLSTARNLCMAAMKDISRGGYITHKLENPYVVKQKDKLQIKVHDITMPVSNLSGGNQQKVLVGNWLNTDPKLMIFDEPSRGIDISAKQQIFQIIWDLSREGISSLFVSTELEELIEVCHRILIMRHGRIIDEVLPENIRLEELYSFCIEA